MRKARLLLLLFAVPIVGYTNCNDFTTVTVPTSDSQDPWAGWKVVKPGGTTETTIGDVDYTTSNFNGTWTLAPFGIDGGGMHRVRIVGASCLSSCIPRTCTALFPNPGQDQQNANPGDSVSNGIYLLKSVTPSSTVASSSCRIDWTWTVEALDFHGNESEATLTLTYD